MASNVTVLDSAFKRTTVKVTPGTHMRDVLEEACKARKWSPESYALKTQTNKIVDLSQPFRLSGLTAGAKLTLVQASRSPSVVNVALQLPDSEGGGRLSDKFPSTTSLWLVLRKYEDAVAGQTARKLNLTQRAVPSSQTAGSGRLDYEQPCLHLMGRNMESFVDLQKTLAQLGLNSGSVLIRLSFKSAGQPLEEAMQEIEQYFKGVDAPSAVSESAPASAPSAVSESAPASAPSAVSESAPSSRPDPATAGTEVDRDSPMPDVDAPPASIVDSEEDIIGTKQADPTGALEQTAPEISVASASQTAEAAPPSQQDEAPPDASSSQDANSTPGMSVYLPPSNSAPAASLQEEDPQTFEPNIEHAKAHQAALTRLTQNKRLLSDKELAEKAAVQEAALEEVKHVIVRVKYPDQSMIETSITADTTAKELYEKVNATLASADAIGNFQLKFMGAKAMEDLPDVANKRLVKSFGFRGKMLVTIIWGDGASAKVRQGPCLKKELMNVAKDLKVELGNQRKEGEASHKAAMDKKPTGTGGKGKNTADFENKMKKLLGFGKK